MTEFGTEPHKLARKDSPETSQEAAEQVDTTYLEHAVYEFIKEQGDYGATAYECIKHFNPVSDSTIHARPSALSRKGLIYYAGDTRIGGSNRQQRVMRMNRRTEQVPVETERRQSQESKTTKIVFSPADLKDKAIRIATGCYLTQSCSPSKFENLSDSDLQALTWDVFDTWQPQEVHKLICDAADYIYNELQNTENAE